jgi:hypothetical protein
LALLRSRLARDGLVIGLGAAWWVSKGFASVLFDARPGDRQCRPTSRSASLRSQVKDGMMKS